MKEHITKKILEELKNEHEGGSSLEHSVAHQKDKKIKDFSYTGDILEGQRNKVIRVTDKESDNDEK
ncbi:MAG: hypothetical protein RR945_02835 [Erysipelotrichaceae bacterium]